MLVILLILAFSVNAAYAMQEGAWFNHKRGETPLYFIHLIAGVGIANLQYERIVGNQIGSNRDLGIGINFPIRDSQFALGVEYLHSRINTRYIMHDQGHILISDWLYLFHALGCRLVYKPTKPAIITATIGGTLGQVDVTGFGTDDLGLSLFTRLTVGFEFDFGQVGVYSNFYNGEPKNRMHTQIVGLFIELNISQFRSNK